MSATERPNRTDRTNRKNKAGTADGEDGMFAIGGDAKRRGPMITRPPKEYSQSELDAISVGYVLLIPEEWQLLKKGDVIKYIATNKKNPVVARVVSTFVNNGERQIRVKSPFGSKTIMWSVPALNLQYVFVKLTAAETAILRRGK